MICPHCGYDNIQGTDECSACKQDLTFLDEPTADSFVERVIMEDPVRMLNPAVPVCVSPEVPIRTVIQTMTDKKIGCILVAEGSELVGILTERDLLMHLAGREKELADDPVREWMTPNPETIDEEDAIAFAIHKMDVGGYRHLPVMEAGRPRGVISVRDIVGFLAGYLA